MTFDSVKYTEALIFAAKKHIQQKRKDGSAYINHPIRVALYLAKEGFDIRYQIVGLFHDLLEDTDATKEEIEKYCDSEMLEAIILLTKTTGYVEKDYIAAILNNNMAKTVKNADRIDNLSDMIQSGDSNFKERYIKETEELFLGHFSKELDELFLRIKADMLQAAK